MDKNKTDSRYVGNPRAALKPRENGARRARDRVLRYLCCFASQVKDPDEVAELERIATLIRQSVTDVDAAETTFD